MKLKSRPDLFETLLETFQALNDSSEGIEYGRAKLEARILAAIRRNDSRGQLGLYERLAEVSNSRIKVG